VVVLIVVMGSAMTGSFLCLYITVDLNIVYLAGSIDVVVGTILGIHSSNLTSVGILMGAGIEVIV